MSTQKYTIVMFGIKLNHKTLPKCKPLVKLFEKARVAYIDELSTYSLKNWDVFMTTFNNSFKFMHHSDK